MPVAPVVVKPMAVPLDVAPVTVASLLIEQPVPHEVCAWTVKVAVVMWVRLPLVPVIVTV